MFDLKFRDSIPTAVLDELENLVNQFKGFLLISFSEDGTLIGSNPMLNVVSVGALNGWLTGTPPEGWLLLDGSQKNRVTYKSLFELWGVTFGVGDGSTTFNLPDMRGRFFLGVAAAGTGSAIGATGGALDHTHSTPSGTSGATAPGGSVSGGATASATATISGSTANESSHTHTYSGTTGEIINPASVPFMADTGAVDISHKHDYSGTTAAGTAHNHGVGTLAVDGHTHGAGSLTISVDSHTHTTPAGTSGTNNPAYFAGNWIVFAGV